MTLLNRMYAAIKPLAQVVNPMNYIKYGIKTTHYSNVTGKVILAIEPFASDNLKQLGFKSIGEWVDYFSWVGIELRDAEREKDFRAPNGIEELLQRYPLEQYRRQQHLETP